MSAAAWPTACRYPGELVRVYVWQWPVRMTHWCTAYAILLLAVTGLYIGHPFLVVTGPAGQHFVMGWAKTIHSYAAIVFALSVLSRVAWMFLGNSYARWDKFLPVRRRRWHGLVGALRYYFFQLRQPPGFVGHNPLAGFTYLFVFLMFLVMITTGLALYSAEAIPGAYMKSFQFLIPIYGGLQLARFIHHLVMWVLILFVVLHVYANALTSALEENGEVDSIFSGYKFVHREDVEKELADEGGEHQRRRRA